MTTTLSGACLCGEITFDLEPPFRDVHICHCTQCAKWTGHQVAATAVHPDNFHLRSGSEILTWYRSSEHAERGFCGTCGSSLFWRLTSGTHISIMAGTLDDPSGLGVDMHIFTKDQRQYVSSVEAAPRYARLPPEFDEQP